MIAKIKRKLRDTLKAQKTQLALHKSLHGNKESGLVVARGFPPIRDESAWIEFWEKKIAETERKLAMAVQ